MEKENRLVIDVGTQSLRASVINRKGETLAFSQQKYPVAIILLRADLQSKMPISIWIGFVWLPTI